MTLPTPDEAMRRYYLDAPFHYKADQAVSVLDADLSVGTGHTLNGEDRSLATLAACVALMIAERSP